MRRTTMAVLGGALALAAVSCSNTVDVISDDVIATVTAPELGADAESVLNAWLPLTIRNNSAHTVFLDASPCSATLERRAGTEWEVVFPGPQSLCPDGQQAIEIAPGGRYDERLEVRVTWSAPIAGEYRLRLGLTARVHQWFVELDESARTSRTFQLR